MTATARQTYQTELHDSAAANMAGMFSADVVWDSSRKPIVQRMTRLESSAIARRTSRELMSDLPAIVRSLRGYDTARSNYAESYLAGLVQASGTREEVEEARFKRKQDLANQRLDDIAFLAVKYRRAAGYRAFCVLSLATEDDPASAELKNTADFEILSQLQERHYQLLLHADLLRHLIKLKPEKYDFDFNKTKAAVSAELMEHGRKVHEGLKQIDICLDGVPVATCLDEITMADGVSTEDLMHNYEHGLAVIDLFRRVNSFMTGELAQAVDRYGRQSDPNMVLEPKV